MAREITDECKAVLKLLGRSRNVLIAGCPGTGKSRLLAEVAHSFVNVPNGTGQGGPMHDPAAVIPIPPSSGAKDIVVPSSSKADRRVFRTVFHQNSKHREFVTGITPNLDPSGDAKSFKVVSGTLFRAAEHAKRESGASLLIIDEINRGPAVQLFGGAIVAIEADKRLMPDGTAGLETQYFELLDPSSGDVVEYALPHDLYILAAMNQADASVEPLDVAFLRRWEPFSLKPDSDVLRSYYGLDQANGSDLPVSPQAASDVFEASVKAWETVNHLISIGRGSEFMIGHGVLITSEDIRGASVEDALEHICIGWAKIRSHVEEVFFGDIRGIAEVFNAAEGPAFNPLSLFETTFADEIRLTLRGPKNFSPANIFSALRAIARPRTNDS